MDDLKIDMVVDYTTPGSTLDDQLRNEQAKAVFDLLASRSRKAAQDDDGC